MELTQHSNNMNNLWRQINTGLNLGSNTFCSDAVNKLLKFAKPQFLNY